MTPTQAIVAATGDAAECIGLGREIGSIEVSKKADILVEDVKMLAGMTRDEKRRYVFRRTLFLTETGYRLSRAGYSPPVDTLGGLVFSLPLRPCHQSLSLRVLFYTQVTAWTAGSQETVTGSTLRRSGTGD